jgi:hypothetical protein
MAFILSESATPLSIKKAKPVFTFQIESKKRFGFTFVKYFLKRLFI